MSPLLLSLKLAVVTTFVLSLIGLPLAWWLSKKRTILRMFAEVLITMPLVLPPSVLGFYLLLAFSPQQGLGKWLHNVFDVQLVFSFPGLVLASVIYSLPFMAGPLRSALQQLPPSLAQASYTLGKSEWQTFRYVLLPNIKPALLTATVLTFAHTLGEFGVVLMIGGNIPGVTRVASVAVYDAVEQMNYDLAQNYSAALFVITFLLLTGVFIYNRSYDKIQS
ncbi:molybdate ABC transporter permease subunit [Mucilaginibacter sp. JRF]|uniref:molybdate ABC transporter permease subunit n=1 Tax=Mucilaginibacter sp. JRF TaxID=2780088 RepID=UPI0018829894|nr:molybdate ABC transporter permease subunit [Mucilaginibacter sp. JRF]MBE9585981.1 molybdate ABC transporter permease subunit [Mucilaginibacter sp. JRF]